MAMDVMATSESQSVAGNLISYVFLWLVMSLDVYLGPGQLHQLGMPPPPPPPPPGPSPHCNKFKTWIKGEVKSTASKKNTKNKQKKNMHATATVNYANSVMHTQDICIEV